MSLDFNTDQYKTYIIQLRKQTSHELPGPFRRFSTLVWQNACKNTVRCAMVCDVYFPLPKILQLY